MRLANVPVPVVPIFQVLPLPMMSFKLLPLAPERLNWSPVWSKAPAPERVIDWPTTLPLSPVVSAKLNNVPVVWVEVTV